MPKVDFVTGEIYGMAVVCRKNAGYGFMMWINSNEHEPPHVHIGQHVQQTDAKLIITEDCPKDIYDLFFIKGSVITGRQKRAIVAWANQLKYKDSNITNWDYLKDEWLMNNDSSEFPDFHKATIWGNAWNV